MLELINQLDGFDPRGKQSLFWLSLFWYFFDLDFNPWPV